MHRMHPRFGRHIFALGEDMVGDDGIEPPTYSV